MMVIPLAVMLVALVVTLRQRSLAGTVGTPAPALPWTPTSVTRDPSRWRVVRTLGLVEARKLAKHPVAACGVVLALLAVGFSTGIDGTQAYSELTGAGAAGLYLPLMVFLAAHLNVTRARRAGAEDLLGAAPPGQVDRTLAACFAGVVAAGAVLAGVLVAYAYFGATGTDMIRRPGPFELLPLPLSVLGAATLGTMIGRWLPWRGVGPPVLVLLVGVSIALAADGPDDIGPLFVPFVDFVGSEEGTRVALPLHVPAAHALYLLGLDAMAVVGAVLRHRRTALWWGLGAAAVLWTAAMGAWQVS
ncbi:MAG TPA: hypothetical protein VNQ77_05680 [Frankiaceae bacterium]|nr:hypothetical protein [Frankiaceae bacterium]